MFRQRLTPEQQSIARLIFLHLAELNENAQDTRRRAPFSELITRSTDEATIQTVINILADARLVTTGTVEPGETKVVEVAHESLIREWPTLRQWLSEDRQGLILHRQLTEATQDWAKESKDAGLLMRGRRLAQIEEWAAKDHNSESLSLQEIDFLEASRQREREEQEKEARLARLRRMQQIFGGVTAVLLVLVGIFGFLVLRPKPPPVMDGLYNVVVTSIGEIGPDGEIQGIANGGAELSQAMASALQNSLQGNQNILIWNDSPELSAKGVHIGALESSTPEGQTEAAAGLAQRLNADMVISGTIDQRKQPPVLNLQMYLAPQLSDTLDEIKGGFELNSPIAVTPDLQAETVRTEVIRQAKLLATLALAQSESKLGHTLEALEGYQQVAQLEPESSLIQFFVGREYLFSLEREPVLQVATNAFEQQALGALEKALQLDPQNARADIGLGTLYLKQAKRMVQEGMNSEFTEQSFQQTLGLLDQAEHFYRQVLQLEVDPAQYGVPVKDVASLGLGDAGLVRGIALQAFGQPDEAEEALRQSVEKLNATLPAFQAPGLSRYLAQNYEFLGSAYQNTAYLLAYSKGDTSAAIELYQKAIEQFDVCIELGSTSSDRVIRSDIVEANCQPSRQETEGLIQKLTGGP